MSFEEDDDNPWGAGAAAEASSSRTSSPSSPFKAAASRRSRDSFEVPETATTTTTDEQSEDDDDEETTAKVEETDDAQESTTVNGGHEEGPPPMDDFDDDGFGQAQDGQDDIDDDGFGQAQDGQDDIDDDDFGDFGDDDGGAFDDFEQAPHEPSPSPSSAPPPQVQSTSSAAFTFEAWRPRQELEQQLRPVLDLLSPGAYDTVNDEPERHSKGPSQILVSESSRTLLFTISSLPALRPLDWKRSRIRREHLISLGVPVNLDDSSTSAPLASLVLPPVNPRSASPGPRSALTPRSSTPIPRNGTPVPSPQQQPAAPPMFDQTRAESLLALSESDLNLMPLARLKSIQADLVKTSNEASLALTNALLAREQQVTDGEAYHVMIQDLVAAASKLKTSSTLGANSASVSRKSSGRWSGSTNQQATRKSSGSPAPR